MANYNIIGRDQKQYGPITEAQLRQWIAEGRVDGQTKIQAEGDIGWKLLSDFQEFRDVAKSSPPPMSAILPGEAPKTSAMAVTSLVLGILGVVTCGLTSLFGLVLGIIAMVKVKNSGGRLTGNGLALAGVIVSGVFFLVMIPIFAAMFLPALSAAKQKAQEIHCVNNVQQLGLAVRIYAGDNKDQFPPAATWCDAINQAVGSEKVFKCNAVNSGSRCDYAFNAKLSGLDINKVNPETVMLFESDGGWNANGGPELMIGNARHARTFVVAFADGSVQQLREAKLGTLRWDP